MIDSEWQQRFLKLAREVSTWSKDPSTQVGAVIVNERRMPLGLGYNGFPRGVKDHPHRYNDRETKYKFVVHAEVNAINNCEHRPEGGHLFLWPLPPCNECAKNIIQSGITHVYYPITGVSHRWEDSHSIANQMFEEAGVYCAGIALITENNT